MMNGGMGMMGMNGGGMSPGDMSAMSGMNTGMNAINQQSSAALTNLMSNPGLANLNSQINNLAQTSSAHSSDGGYSTGGMNNMNQGLSASSSASGVKLSLQDAMGFNTAVAEFHN